MPRGGARTPSNPAPASGPGSLSRRTDGGPAKPQYVAGLPYGEGQEFMDVQTSAPMGGAAPTAPSMPQGGLGPIGSGGGGVTPMGAPTEFPDESVFAGSDNPGGPGRDALASNLSNLSNAEAKQFAKYLPALEAAANSPQTTDSFRRFVRYLRSVQNG